MKPRPVPRIGVVGADNLVAVTAELGAGVHDLDAFAAFASPRGYRQLWFHPSAVAALGLPPTLDARTPGEIARTGSPHDFVTTRRFAFTPAGLSHWIVGRELVDGFHASGPRLDVAFPSYDGASPFATARDAGELRAAVIAFATALGVPYTRTPGTTGAVLLRAVHSGPGARRLAAPGELPPPALVPATERDFAWWRPPDLAERAMPFVHAYDVNGNYLAAASSVELGVGEYADLDGPLGSITAQPGYWLLRLRPADPRLPDPFDPAGRGRAGPRWFATPAAELARDLGRIQRIERAHVWPERSRVLAPWYERLRDARHTLAVDAAGQPTANLLALAAVKRTTNLTIGQLAGHFRDNADELRRPDWRHHVIARARANTYRHLARAAHHGRHPLAVDVDCVYYPSTSADPAADAPVPLGSQLGHWKHAGSAPMVDALECLSDARSGPLRHLRALLRGNLRGNL